MNTQLVANLSEPCAKCGIPLNYERLLAPRSCQGNGERARICSTCLKQNASKKRITKNEDNAWILKLILMLHEIEPARLLAAGLSRLVPKHDGPLNQLALVLRSVPKVDRRAKYDAVVLYSGGKDSTYMLLDLSRRGLRVCAWMLNQGYQSPSAIANARRICEKLNVPLVIDEPGKDSMDELFRVGFGISVKDSPELVRAAMTYGSACWPCFSMIAARATVFCAINRVPFCFIGTQEGQNRLDLDGEAALSQRGLPRLADLTVRFMKPFRDYAAKCGVPAARLLESSLCDTALIPFYEFVKKPPLAKQIEILNQAGWELPKNTGMCSTNCMVNELGRQVMRSQFGFDLYQLIDANERRLGNEVGHNATAKDELFPELDVKAVLSGAKLIKLSSDERKRFGLIDEAQPNDESSN